MSEGEYTKINLAPKEGTLWKKQFKNHKCTFLAKFSFAISFHTNNTYKKTYLQHF